jgi:hypothetical protein
MVEMETAVCRERWLSVTLAYLLILLADDQSQYHDDEVGKTKRVQHLDVVLAIENLQMMPAGCDARREASQRHVT